jgi:hypothetical protein
LYFACVGGVLFAIGCFIFAWWVSSLLVCLSDRFA